LSIVFDLFKRYNKIKTVFGGKYMSKLALLGGEPFIKEAAPKELFKWPIITEEDKANVMWVVENNRFSATDITQKFEAQFAEWQG
jgi:hypothetical protein